MSREAWSEDEWAAGLESFAARGFVDGAGAFTDAGLAQRQQIEDATDRAALVAYEALTDDEADEVVAIGRMLTEQRCGGRSAAGRSVALRRLLTAPAVRRRAQVRGRADGQPADMPPRASAWRVPAAHSDTLEWLEQRRTLQRQPGSWTFLPRERAGRDWCGRRRTRRTKPVAGRSHAAPALRRSR